MVVGCSVAALVGMVVGVSAGVPVGVGPIPMGVAEALLTGPLYTGHGRSVALMFVST